MKPLLSYQWTTAIIGLMIALIILFLIRRDILHVKRSLWWIGIAVLIVVMGFFPLTIAQIWSAFGCKLSANTHFDSGGRIYTDQNPVDGSGAFTTGTNAAPFNPENSNAREFPGRGESHGKNRIEGPRRKTK